MVKSSKQIVVRSYSFADMIRDSLAEITIRDKCIAFKKIVFRTRTGNLLYPHIAKKHKHCYTTFIYFFKDIVGQQLSISADFVPETQTAMAYLCLFQLNALMDEARKFFYLPETTKQKYPYRIGNVYERSGYRHMERERYFPLKYSFVRVTKFLFVTYQCLLVFDYIT